ncbi:MAG TPA: hypothetical protein VEV61_02880 [Streptosporangiaceae bacterium]|nr:hypothetical protein [Streptosporangiaceae bacterium]
MAQCELLGNWEKSRRPCGELLFLSAQKSYARAEISWRAWLFHELD